MGSLSRRAFLGRTALVAASLGVPADLLRSHLVSTTAPVGDVPSTLLQTVLHGGGTRGKYRTLITGSGEPYLPRLDVLRRTADASRTGRRRSLLYLGHLSDLHVIDAQSPARIEPMIVQDHAAWGSAFHPQDPLSPHTTAAMVHAFYVEIKVGDNIAEVLGGVEIVTKDNEVVEIRQRQMIEEEDEAPATPIITPGADR